MRILPLVEDYCYCSRGLVLCFSLKSEHDPCPFWYLQQPVTILDGETGPLWNVL